MIAIAVQLASASAFANDGVAGWKTHAPEREEIASEIIKGRVGSARLIATEPRGSRRYVYSAEVEITTVEKGPLKVGERIQVEFHSTFDEENINQAHHYFISCGPQFATPLPCELARLYLVRRGSSAFATDYPEGILAIPDPSEDEAASVRREAARVRKQEQRRMFIFRTTAISLTGAMSLTAMIVRFRSRRKSSNSPTV